MSRGAERACQETTAAGVQRGEISLRGRSPPLLTCEWPFLTPFPPSPPLPTLPPQALVIWDSRIVAGVGPEYRGGADPGACRPAKSPPPIGGDAGRIERAACGYALANLPLRMKVGGREEGGQGGPSL